MSPNQLELPLTLIAPSSALGEVREALEGLGYQSAEIRQAIKGLGDDERGVEDLLRAALRKLGGG